MSTERVPLLKRPRRVCRRSYVPYLYELTEGRELATQRPDEAELLAVPSYDLTAMHGIKVKFFHDRVSGGEYLRVTYADGRVRWWLQRRAAHKEFEEGF